MTADDIERRLEYAGLAGNIDGMWIEAYGRIPAWEKMVGPTKEQVKQAVRDAVNNLDYDAGTEEYVNAIIARLYP